ncbi:MAG TPA: WYL domain-containing protein, partial [Gaiellaceae bacterium]|nr:WYL domain-containing protein [Gaiellaceae bacterium]
LAGWVLRQNGRAVPQEPVELVEAVGAALSALADAHDGDAPGVAGPKRTDPRRPLPERPAGPVAPERFGVLQALLAHLLAACGEERSTTLDATEVAARFSIPLEELQDHLSLLNLVNFGGGCYAVYAEHDGDVVRVEKELYGDVFRRPPKLTPLEARAIHLAMEYVGPTIAADAHTPLKRVRKKLEETFGRFDLAANPQTRDGSAEETLVRVLSDGVDKRVVVEIEYMKDGDDSPTMRLVEPYTIERELPVWRVHTWDLSVDAARTFRLDRMRSARLTGDHFDARDGFDPSYLRDPRVARLLHSPEVARWKLERGARALTDGSAVADVPYKTEEWLLSEILADRGETIVLEPQRLRDVVAKRARRLQRELGRVPSRR